MEAPEPQPISTPCLCNALRQASRAVSRLYDEELRSVGLKTTQYSLLRWLQRAGEVRQRELGALTSLDETTLSRNLRLLVDGGLVAVRAGDDRRERWVSLTGEGEAKLTEAAPAWERAQERMRSLLPGTMWHDLLSTLPEVARLTAQE